MKNKAMIGFLISSIFFISIGFAALNTELSISGDAYVNVKKEIKITNVEMIEATNQGYETYNAVFSNDEVSLFATLPDKDSTLSYYIEIINYTENEYILNDLKINNENTNIHYEIENLESQDVFARTKKVLVKITFSNDQNTQESTTFQLNLGFEIYQDTEPNVPVIASNMIPVYYDEFAKVWKKADSSNTDINYGWYNYRKKNWANAVTVTSTNRTMYLNSSPGTTIDMDDINTMWVWIPRFTSVIPSNYNGGTKENPGEIKITFASSSSGSANDAFSFGNQELSGLWVAKFENSATTLPTESDTISRDVVIKPGVAQWTNTNVSTFFSSILKMREEGNIYGFDTNLNPTLDSHMIKNNEWAAVAYLVNSKYGRCLNGVCEEVRLNNCKNHKTGVGSDDNTFWSGAVVCDSVPNQYDGSVGVLASSTANTSGIYDMSGGVNEYVMGVYPGNLGKSGFTHFPSDQYFNTYQSLYTGHAILETKGWYSDYSELFVSNYADKAWLVRGGFNNDRTLAGVYYWMASGGEANANRGTRSVLTIN